MAKGRKPKWQAEKVINGRRCYARMSVGEIIVRVEKDGDTTKYSEWGMPKYIGLIAAMEVAESQTNDEDIKS